MSLIETTKSAIDALSHPQETVRANEWLVNFERSATSWEVAELLLREPVTAVQYRFFGAKFLYSKLQRQFFQLDDNNVQLLTQSLVDNIIRLSQEQPIELNVCRYVCLALATLALQQNQPGIVSQLLAWLGPIINTAPAVLLELLIVLPEESCNRYVDVSIDIRDAFIDQLAHSSNQVLSFLSSLWPSATSDNVKAKILCCADRWIDITGITAKDLLQHTIYQHILEGLLQEPIFESAVDAVITILQRYQCREQPIIETVIPRVLHLRSMWSMKCQQFVNCSADEIDEEEVNLCRALCRLFTETSEACMEAFVTFKLNVGQEELMVQLLECTRFTADPVVARLPLKFFYELSVVAKIDFNSKESFNPSSFGGLTREQTIALNQKYANSYTELLDVAIVQMMLDSETLIGDKETSEEKVETRMEWTETVIDSCCVLGPVICLEFFCTRIQQLITSSDNSNLQQFLKWSKIEVILLCVLTISEFVSRKEDKFLPQIMDFISTVPENLLKVQITVIELIGRYSFWFENHPETITKILTKLIGDLQRPQTCTTASRAITNIFHGARRISNLPHEELHNIILSCRASQINNNGTINTSGGLPLDAELTLLEGVAVSISYLPADQSKHAFKSVMTPIAGALHNKLQLISTGKIADSEAKLLSPDIDRVTTIFRNYEGDGDAIAEVFNDMFALLRNCLMVNSSESFCERVCKCIKHALRGSKGKLVQFLPDLVGFVVEKFKQVTVAAFLYSASVCMKDFGRLKDEQINSLLVNMMWEMSSTFFSKFSSVAQFEQKPDVVEEYYFLVAKAVQFFPLHFIQSPDHVNTITQAAVLGLKLHHREAQKGVLMYLENLVQMPFDFNKPELLQQHNTSKALVMSFGQNIVSGIFSLLSGEEIAYALDEGDGCITDVLWCLKRKYPENFQVLFELLLEESLCFF